MKRQQCRACGRIILAAPLLHGTKALLLEPKPDPEGSVVMEAARSESGIEVGARFPRFLSRHEMNKLAALLPAARPERWRAHGDVCHGRRKKAAGPIERREPCA